MTVTSFLAFFETILLTCKLGLTSSFDVVVLEAGIKHLN